ncbi:MAG: hypothetical protein BHW23_04400 [Lachnospira eligens]|nr:MAG: hypothetical protein BHW23_04400 [Lachnospira eligens]
MIHSATFFTNRNTIFANGKVVFIFGFNTPFFILKKARRNPRKSCLEAGFSKGKIMVSVKDKSRFQKRSIIS